MLLQGDVPAARIPLGFHTNELLCASDGELMCKQLINVAAAAAVNGNDEI